MRIDRHPILTFERGREIEFEFDGRRLRGCEGETIAAALHAAGVRVLRESIRLGRPRGFFCAIGRCSSCLMTVNGVPNVMTCITPLEEGMRVETQRTKGTVPDGGHPGGDAPADADGVPIVAWGEAPGESLGDVPLAVVGGGPAGLSAAIAAGRLGVRSVVIDENQTAGGQLIKQTHMFFGSREHHARVRGVDIGPKLLSELEELPVELMLGTTALGLYNDLTLSLLVEGRHRRLSPETIIVATGASENMLAFENSDLPGVYGAGAVQTLMNVHGVVPGDRVLMVGAGNIGLIVSYQLLQAGVEVAAVIEGMPEVGGYHVHAAKIRRAGVPILTSHTIVRAEGETTVTGAKVVEVDESWRPVDGTERRLDVDTICLAVGLTPNVELAFQAGTREAHVRELGGRVAVHGPDLETSIPGLYIAGDASGIEEASTAMLEGRLAGLAAAKRLGAGDPAKIDALVSEAAAGLAALRAGPFGRQPRYGKERMFALKNREGTDESQA
ncbi:MAG: FAD-dependent oxidoreductase [Candidatus Eisenbacteria bacterium]|nr:FAD-dependent oxidoreductase [Candidatus Eisenbacteria bacterium]